MEHWKRWERWNFSVPNTCLSFCDVWRVTLVLHGFTWLFRRHLMRFVGHLTWNKHRTGKAIGCASFSGRRWAEGGDAWSCCGKFDRAKCREASETTWTQLWNSHCNWDNRSLDNYTWKIWAPKGFSLLIGWTRDQSKLGGSKTIQVLETTGVARFARNTSIKQYSKKPGC